MVTMKKWPQDVSDRSQALAPEDRIFTSTDPVEIARVLKQSAEDNHRRKDAPYHSAVSRLDLYMDHAGCDLSEAQRMVLEKAKGELRGLFGKDNVRP